MKSIIFKYLIWVILFLAWFSTIDNLLAPTYGSFVVNQLNDDSLTYVASKNFDSIVRACGFIFLIPPTYFLIKTKK